MKELSQSRRNKQQGQGMAEYALILSLIALVVIIVVLLTGGGVKTGFNSTAKGFDQPPAIASLTVTPATECWCGSAHNPSAVATLTKDLSGTGYTVNFLLHYDNNSDNPVCNAGGNSGTSVTCSPQISYVATWTFTAELRDGSGNIVDSQTATYTQT